MFTLDSFYSSKDWRSFREIVIHERTRPDGFIYDEVTGKPILHRYDVILHHVIPLTNENVNDATVALNPANIQIVSHRTHNFIHDKLGYKRKEIYLVYGPPLAGKNTYVEGVLSPGDLIVDIDRIWQCVSGQPAYVKPPRLNAVVFAVRDCLYDAVRMRTGKWNNAYIVGGFPLVSERERLCQMYGAREVYVEASREESLRRLHENGDGRDLEAWEKYIDEWWRRYTPPPGG